MPVLDNAANMGCHVSVYLTGSTQACNNGSDATVVLDINGEAQSPDKHVIVGAGVASGGFSMGGKGSADQGLDKQQPQKASSQSKEASVFKYK